MNPVSTPNQVNIDENEESRQPLMDNGVSSVGLSSSPVPVFYLWDNYSLLINKILSMLQIQEETNLSFIEWIARGLRSISLFFSVQFVRHKMRPSWRRYREAIEHSRPDIPEDYFENLLNNPMCECEFE